MGIKTKLAKGPNPQSVKKKSRAGIKNSPGSIKKRMRKGKRSKALSLLKKEGKEGVVLV
jgi:hypothetical protein